MGDRLMIGIELVDVVNESQLWGEQFNRKFSDIFEIQEEIAKEISEKLQLKLSGAEKRRLTKRHTEKTEAYQLFLKGRFFCNKRTGEALKKGIDYFQQAIEIDPGYAVAYAGLADCYALLSWWRILPPMEGYPKAKGAASRALEIDDRLVEAHATLALVKMIYDWDSVSAEREFKRAIEFNPNYALAHHWYGACLIALGRLDQSLTEMKLAQQLDPLTLIFNTGIANTLYHARRYEEATEQFLKTLDLDQTFFPARLLLGVTYERRGMYEGAITELQKAVTQSEGDPLSLAMLGYTYAVSDHREEAEKLLDDDPMLPGEIVAATFSPGCINKAKK